MICGIKQLSFKLLYYENKQNIFSGEIVLMRPRSNKGKKWKKKETSEVAAQSPFDSAVITESLQKIINGKKKEPAPEYLP